NGIQTFLPRMADRGQGGHIVNTASGAGLVHSGSGVLYHTAKYGVVGMSEALNAELQPHAIGVSVLCPGPVATKIVDNTLSHQPGMDAMPEAQKAAIQQLLAPTKKFLDEGVSPDAVGDMVLAAVKANQLFIHTDRLVEPMIQARTKALLAAFPPV
ncbi:MAG TPA: SDR family NAD(P)-dependent oxidoreductase, partial [Rhizomicrobium sp.]|nr:SDR family NAD(P)-dependent oxidoreductase [Rhizomicrobium sp.]